MIHQRITEDYESGKAALNKVTGLFPYIQQGEEGHKERVELRSDLSSAWGAVIHLYDEVELRDKRLDDSHAVLEDLIANVPEARAYYQRMLDEGNRYKKVLSDLKDKEPLVRY